VPATPEKEKAKAKEGAVARVICVQSLSEKEEEVVLATKPEGGVWKEYDKLTLRSPYMGEWINVPVGVSHILKKKDGEFVSLGSFTIGETLKRSILILLPEKKNNTYRVQVIDPSKLGFKKGKALIVNYSNLNAIVNIGDHASIVKSGGQAVEQINANPDGMYRLLIGHIDKDKKTVACYDHYLSSNPNTRKFILLFPDPDSGLRAMSLSEFDPIE
jgi:hypothetical protein